MRINVKNIRAKFHPDSIWNEGAYKTVFWRGRPHHPSSSVSNKRHVSILSTLTT